MMAGMKFLQGLRKMYHVRLNETGLHRLIYLNACFSVGGTVWEGLRGVALLEQVCHWVWALRFQKPTLSS